jgi:hypothetical protein
MFWERWFKFELEQPSSEADQGQRVKHVFDELRNQSRLSPAVKKELSQVYLDYLVQSGGKDAMKVFLEVDREMFGLVIAPNYALPLFPLDNDADVKQTTLDRDSIQDWRWC